MIRLVKIVWIIRFTSLINLTSTFSHFFFFSLSQKQRYMPACPFTSTGRKTAAVSFFCANRRANPSGIMESDEIIYGFPLKNGSSSFGTPCSFAICGSRPPPAYSQIISTVFCSWFSRSSAPAEIPRYSQASFKMSSTIFVKLFSDSSIFKMEVIASFLFSCSFICVSDSLLLLKASCANTSSIFTAKICFESDSKNSNDL